MDKPGPAPYEQFGRASIYPCRNDTYNIATRIIRRSYNLIAYELLDRFLGFGFESSFQLSSITELDNKIA